MRHLRISISILPVLIAFSASAQTTDSHAGHHMDEAVKTQVPSKADPDQHCPMMRDGRGAIPTGTKSQDHPATGDRMEHCKAMQTQDHEKGEKK